MRNRLLPFVTLGLLFVFTSRCFGQGVAAGTLDVTVRIAATGGRPEPVRQFTFYVFTKSYSDIRTEVGAQFPIDDRDTFISKLSITPELKAWMKKHAIVDLMAPDTDKLITPDDIMNIPEFFAAYERSNSGGVTKGLPMPKYRDSDQQSNPEKYEKLKQEYLAATRKFIETNPGTITGMEIELAGVNPKYYWDKMLADHNQKVAQVAPDVAQGKYLAAKGDTDLDGRLVFTGVPAGNYWVSSMGQDAAAGDRHLLWDVPVKVAAGQTARVELSNLNGVDLKSEHP